MIKAIQMFEDANGETHRTALAALKADLTIWLVSTQAVNDASAKKLVDHICGDRKKLSQFGDMLSAIQGELPATEPEQVMAA